MNKTSTLTMLKNISVSRTTDGDWWTQTPVKISSTFSANSTLIMSQVLSDDLLQQFDFYLILVFLPFVGVTGIAGCSVSFIILLKRLNKPSNILLISLSTADILCLLGALDVAGFLEYFSKLKSFPSVAAHGWEMTYAEALACYILATTIKAITPVGFRISSGVTVLITIERVLALCFPLKFKVMVTCTRTWFAVGSLVAFWLPYTTFNFLWYEFHFVDLPNYNTTVGRTRLSNFTQSESFNLLWFVDNVIFSFSHSVPLALVVTGCFVIAIRVYLSIQTRQRMLSNVSRKRGSFSRTTKSLFMVGFFFSLSRIISLLYFLPFYNQSDKRWGNVSLLLQNVLYVLTMVNSASNFFIYIAFNKTFRLRLLELFPSSTSCCDFKDTFIIFHFTN